MFILIASDSQSISTKIRKALALQGHECPITHLVGLDQVLSLLQSAATAVDLIFVLLPADESASLGIIRRVRALTTAQLVAVGSSVSSKLILEALHAGADDYLDEDAEMGDQVRAAVERMELRSEAVPTGRLVAVTKASGGCGASLVAANVSVKIAQRGTGCGLMELPSGFGDLGALFNMAPRYSIADLLRNQESLDRTMLEQSTAVHPSGVSLLAAANPFEDVDAFDGPAVGRIIAISRSAHPWTVIDLESRCGLHADILKSAHSIILTFRFDFTALCNVRRLLDGWNELQIDPDRIMLVGNRFGQSGDVPLDQAQSLLGREIAVRIPEDALHVNVAANCGNPIILESPKCTVSRALSQIADRVVGSCAPGDRSAATGEPAHGWHGNPIVKKVAGVLFC